MKWSDATELGSSVLEYPFHFQAGGERVPGLLWLPADPDASNLSLVLAGHGGFTHKASEGTLRLAKNLVGQGAYAVVALDAPLHGERRPSHLENHWQAWIEYWRSTGAVAFADQLCFVIDQMQKHPKINKGKVGYWGLSLATQYGLALLSRETRICVAVLGLFGLHDESGKLAEYAEAVGCDVYFIAQQADQFHTEEQTGALYNRLGTSQKQKRSSPGDHFEVPNEVFDDAIAFLKQRLAS